MNNRATKLSIAVMMAIGFTSVASASDRNSQIAHEEDIPMTVAADRVQVCVDEDATGEHCKPQGFNATPSQILAMIRQNPNLNQEHMPQNVAELPRFLRSLHSMPFTSPLCLAGMGGKQLLTDCPIFRGPRNSKEVLWAYEGEPVLAGNCFNGVVAVQVKGERMADARPARTIPVRRGAVSESGCQNDNRYLTIRIYDAAAASNTCAVNRMHPATDMRPALTGKGRVGSYVLNGTEQEFSRMCGEELYGLANAGKIGWSAQQQPVEVVVLVGNQEYPVFTGTVQGASLVGADEKSNALIVNGDTIRIPDIYDKGIVVAHFPNGSLRSVTESGIGADLSQMTTGCRRNVFTAIEGGGNGNQNPVAWE